LREKPFPGKRGRRRGDPELRKKIEMRDELVMPTRKDAIVIERGPRKD